EDRSPHNPLHLLPDERALRRDVSSHQQRTARHERDHKVEETETIKNVDERFRHTTSLNTYRAQPTAEINKSYERQENDRGVQQQQDCRNVKHNRAPTLLRKKLLLRRVKRTEVQKERREYDEGRIFQKGDRQIEIAISPGRGVEMKDK